MKTLKCLEDWLIIIQDESIKQEIRHSFRSRYRPDVDVSLTHIIGHMTWLCDEERISFWAKKTLLYNKVKRI